MNKKLVVSLLIGTQLLGVGYLNTYINEKNNMEFRKIKLEENHNYFDDGQLKGEPIKLRSDELLEEKIVKVNDKLSIIEKDLKWAEELNLTNEPEKLILHHIAATRSDTIKVEEVHRWHLQNKWAGIGYHFYINKNGEVYRGRPENAVGAHAKDNNINTIGIAVEGDYEFENMPLKQKDAVINLGVYLRNKYSLDKVEKHKDVNSTSCPGKNYPFESIKKNILKSPVSIEDNYEWQVENGKTYYIDIATGEKMIGKRFIGESTYYFNEDGEMQIGWQIINGQYHYFDTNGYMLTGLVYLGESTYLFNEEGMMQIGWQLVDGKQYYFDTNGYMLKGFVYLGESTYYFNEEGIMQIGWQLVDGKQYYFDTNGYMLKGFVYLGESTYYFNENGEMQIGWQIINGEYHYFDTNGYMLTGFVYLGESDYYFNEKGIMQIGWQTIENQKYYFYENGYMAKDTVIDGIIIDKNGVAK
ncbi:MAG: N-acetylmuramoyl-L-alanine amidase [Sarcina sp.]